MISGYDLVEITGLALVIALSPVPVTGQLLLVLTNRTQWTAATLATGWAVAVVVLCGLAATGAALLLPRIVVDWPEVPIVTLVVGIGLAAGGIFVWRRPVASPDASPSRIARLFSGLGPTRALLIGVGYGGLRPKNFIAAVAAGLIIGAGSSFWEGTVLVLYFAAVASASLAAPVLTYVLGGPKTRDGMRRLHVFLSRNGIRITGVALAAIGVIVAGFGLTQAVS
jgi:hypothetical protein